MRIAVTGASGFVGGAVARDAVARGHEVWTYSRRPDGIHGARHRRWDLTDGPLGDAPAVDVVVHAGAVVSDWSDLGVARAVNVAGTRAVRETFGDARFVHVSSGSVYDPFAPSVRAEESEAPVDHYLEPYGRTKAEAEQYLFDDVRRDVRGGVVILRPHAVYGPGDGTLLPRIEAAVRGGFLVLPGGGRVRQSLTHVETLLAAVRSAATIEDGALAAACPATDGGAVPLVVNVADAEPVVLRDAVVDVLRRRGVRVRVVTVPTRAAWALAGAAERRARARCSAAPRLTRYALSHLATERTYHLRVLREVLGVIPAPTSFAGAEHW